LKSSVNKTTQSDPGSSSAQTVGAQALQKKAVSVIQNMEVPEGDKEYDEAPVQRRENKTGIPDNLKSGIENISGMSMDHVKVHYNSSQPAQLNALAYAQGSDIHIGPGQEKHLPHEAWHVVQQAQGRVQATKQMKAAVPVNDDPGLEQEADVMGVKAMQMKSGSVSNKSAKEQNSSLPLSVFQMKRRDAIVTWGVTHLVKAQGDSLFGAEEKDGWKAGELPVEEGELTQGKPIVVDDEIVFMSRRGSNQEDEEKRKKDHKQELNQKWNLVYEVDETDYEDQDVYIRSETIRYTKDEPKERKDIGIVEMPEENVPEQLLTERLLQIQAAWAQVALKRRRSIDQVKYKNKKEEEAQNGEDQVVDDEQVDKEEDTLPEGLSSGWNWDQYDEGEDVAGEMAIPDYREFGLSDQPTNFMLTAHYTGEEVDIPIAYLMMEKNTRKKRLFKDDFEHVPPEPEFFYIRWLVGDPIKKGGGIKLMTEAKRKAFENQLVIYVQVAYSAVDKYAEFDVVEKGAFVEGQGYGDTLLKYTPPNLG
jgi:hypothetical protein